MNSQQKFVAMTLGNHPVNLLFRVDPLKYVRGRAVLHLNLRDEFTRDSSESAGLLGLVADYMARLAGSEFIGNCFVLEQEICVHSGAPGNALMASAHIECSDNMNAAYSCKLYSVKGTRNRLVGESQGTLVSS